MKRLIALLLATLIVTLFPINALAEDGDEVLPTPVPTQSPAPSPTPTPKPNALETDEPTRPTASVVYFEIDNANIYAGMDRSYNKGYTPIVSNGVATIVLPLLVSGEIKGNTLTATPNLGDPNSAPFVFKSYQKNIQLTQNPINNGAATKEVYYIRFDLALASSRVMGTYAVHVEVSARGMDGSPITQTFTLYVTIKDGKDPNYTPPPPSVPGPERPTSQPIVMVTGHRLTPDSLKAGDEFTALVTLKNTNEKKAVQNMTITVTNESPFLTLLNESNSVYYKSLAKGATLELELKYKTSMEAPAGKYAINIAMAYDNSDAQTLTSSGLVTVEISQPMRVEMEMPQIAKEVNAGDTLPLSFNVMNLGRGKVYNVRVALNAPGLLPNASAFIGNMEAGTSGTADMNVFVGTKDMSEGYDGSDKYGYTSGTATLIYEDENGVEYTQEFELSTTINAPIINTVSNEIEVEPEKASQWWISLIVAGALAAGVGVYLFTRKQKRNRQADESNDD